jgi:hypothetical protein
MKFPSLEFVKALQTKLNADSAFFTASKWSDVKVLLCFGNKRYWLKLYGGKVIDVMEYLPNPLGWDYMITASIENWEALREKRKPVGELINYGHIVIDGNVIQANRMYESSYIILETIRDLK